MKARIMKVYVISYETQFGTCIEYTRTYSKFEADAAVTSLMEDGTRAYLDIDYEIIYR